MKKPMKSTISAVFIVFLLVSIIPIQVQAQVESGDITFQPNIIPELKITFREREYFHFTWKKNSFDLKLSIAYNDTKKEELEFHSLKDFFMKVKEETDTTINWQNMCRRATDSMYEFGYNITEIPPEISNNVEYLLWKIEGASFNTSKESKEIQLEEIEILDNQTTGELLEKSYNITRFHLPDNLVLSYEDLWLYNFTVSHPNNFDTIVKGKGLKEKSWNLDPITFSDNTMTMTDFGSIGAWAGNLFWEFWNASDANSWDVAEKTDWGENIQFTFGCLLQIGNGTKAGACWVYDTNVQVVFNSTSVSASYDNLIRVTANSHLRLGTLLDETDKTTSNGVSIQHQVNITYYYTIIIQADSGSDVNFYSSSFKTNSGLYSTEPILSLGSGTTTKIYECTLENCHIVGDNSANYDVYRLTIKEAYQGLFQMAGTFDDILLHKIKYPISKYYGTSITLNNLVIQNSITSAFLFYDIYAHVYVINTDVDSWAITWSGTNTAYLYRQYTFDLTVTYPNGTGIQNANVTVKHYGRGEIQDFTELTDSNGQISQKTLSMGFYNQTGGDTIYNYNPYNIEITNVTGYQDYCNNFTLSEKETLVIGLCISFGPTSIFDFDPSNPRINEEVDFDAAESTGDITTYFWTFGDDNSDSGVTVSHAYNTTDQYTVTLTVTDSDGLTDTFSQDVYVETPATTGTVLAGLAILGSILLIFCVGYLFIRKR